MMKKIVAWLFFLSLIVGAIALVVPGFIDWSKHKDSILAQLEPYIGRKMQVDGNVGFRIIPSPQIMLENVTLANVGGAKAPHFMKLKQLEARMKLGPLLEGRFEIETINLANPELNLEVLPDGQNNWSGIFKADAGSARPDAVRLNNVSMTGGILHSSNSATGAEWQVDDLDLTVSADTLSGPYKARGGMRYNNTAVGIEAGTGRYETGAPVPFNITFTPTENMPKVVLSGVADLSSDLGLQTEVAVSDGALASLFGNAFLNGIEFLNEPANATAMLNVKGSEISLTDIKAKVGKKGAFSGTAGVIFAPGKKPDLTADLVGSDLKVTSKAAFLEVPAGFTPHLKLKAQSVTWNGARLPGVTVAVDANDKEWVVKEARIELGGKSKIKLAGVVTPKTQYGAFSIQVNSEDAQKMLKGSALADANILKGLGASGLLKKIELSGSIDVKSDKISLFDIDAKVNGGTKVSGVLNITRGAKRPAFEAHLNFDRGDIAAVLSDDYAVFMAGLMKADAKLDITVKDFTKGDLAAADFSFKGAVDDGALKIENMSGVFAASGGFSVNGRLASINPLSGMELEYTLKVPQLGGLSAYGVEIPPPLWGSNAADVKGRVTGDASKYAFTVNGADMSLEGAATAGNQGTYSYQTDVSLKNATWSAIGLPVDNLLAEGKPFSFSAKLGGTRGAYLLDRIKAGDVTGTLSRKNGKYTGELVADTVNFDKWLWENWKVTGPLELKLSGKKLVWRSNDLGNPRLTLEAGPENIKVSDFTGDLWGGAVTADVTSERKDGKWKGALKGKILGADLQEFAGLLEFKGFTISKGDLVFDVTDDDKKTETNWFHGMDGDISLQADSLTVEEFSPAALSRLLTGIEGAGSENFPVQAIDALRSANTTYRNIDGVFKMGEGKIVIEKLVLADADATVKVGGDFDLGPETFRIDAAVQLQKPSGVPAFSVNRAGEMENPPSYAAALRPVENWLAKSNRAAPLVLEPDEKPLRETVILPETAPITIEQPIQVYPPVTDPAPEIFTDPEELPVEHPPVEPPPAVTSGDETDEIINTAPIDTEQLSSPVPPQPEIPLPRDEGKMDGGKMDDIKGVIDRLNALPPELDAPAVDFNLQKPDAPAPVEPMPAEEIFPKEP